MKKFAVIAALILAVAVSAAEKKQKYEVRCPECLEKQILAAKKTMVNGSYATNFNSIAGYMQQSTGLFKCGKTKCRADFSTPIKPDKFVPAMVATPVKD